MYSRPTGRPITAVSVSLSCISSIFAEATPWITAERSLLYQAHMSQACRQKIPLKRGLILLKIISFNKMISVSVSCSCQS